MYNAEIVLPVDNLLIYSHEHHKHYYDHVASDLKFSNTECFFIHMIVKMTYVVYIKVGITAAKF